ncbi:hypothetical protein AVEN_198861-1 [Araneus ventricosus]|uniref:Uncharacterized protein n=1 Tax=Araneus ventricosus TaxID=182803 RepID=A0A4Y2V583_ARAVE|nr:hypothetical protein AVEN_198861-1 [Araneus ventricosus]
MVEVCKDSRLQEAKLSKEDRERLKKAFMKCNDIGRMEWENRKLKRFFEFLDETNANADKEKKVQKHVSPECCSHRTNPRAIGTGYLFCAPLCRKGAVLVRDGDGAFVIRFCIHRVRLLSYPLRKKVYKLQILLNEGLILHLEALEYCSYLLQKFKITN